MHNNSSGCQVPVPGSSLSLHWFTRSPPRYLLLLILLHYINVYTSPCLFILHIYPIFQALFYPTKRTSHLIFLPARVCCVASGLGSAMFFISAWAGPLQWAHEVGNLTLRQRGCDFIQRLTIYVLKVSGEYYAENVIYGNRWWDR